MRQGFLHADDGPAIPVQLVPGPGTVLLECREPVAFLRQVLTAERAPDLAPDTYLRGVITEGGGAIFQFFDQFGAVSPDVLRLGADQAQDLLRKIW